MKQPRKMLWAKVGGRTNTKRGKIRNKIFVFFRIFLSFVCSYLPLAVFAAAPLTTPRNLTEFVNNFNTILNPILLFVAGFGFFGFITGVLKYANAGGDEERLGKAKQLIAYGLVGMLIMFSFWGIAKILAGSYLGGV